MSQDRVAVNGHESFTLQGREDTCGGPVHFIPTMPLGIRRMSLMVAVVAALTCGGLMNDAFAGAGGRTWQTDKVKLLDSPELINSTVRVLNGALPGTNKQSDGGKVSYDIVQMLFAELKGENGVQAETALAILGALAGFSVQMALRETLV